MTNQQEPGPDEKSAGSASRTRLWIFGGIGVLVLAGVVTTAVVLTMSGGGGDARAAAQRWVDAGNKSDIATVVSLTCQSERDKMRQALAGSSSSSTDNATVGNVTVNGDHGTFVLNDVTQMDGATKNSAVSFDLVRESGAWKVCGILKAAQQIANSDGGN